MLNNVAQKCPFDSIHWPSVAKDICYLSYMRKYGQEYLANHTSIYSGEYLGDNHIIKALIHWTDSC